MLRVPLALANTMIHKDYSRNFGNDYSDHFVRTGTFPQTHVQNIDDPQIGYSRLQRLHELKAQHNFDNTRDPVGCRLAVGAYAQELGKWVENGLQFNVVVVGGCIDYRIADWVSVLPVAQLTVRPSLLVICVESRDVESARAAMDAWGFRRSEDIVYMAASKSSVFCPPQRQDGYLCKTTWHCLLGIKGTLRRSEDSALVHCNVDTDVVIENGRDRANVIPERIYQVIENFTAMGNRLHIVPGCSPRLPVRMRKGWVIVSPDALLDNYSLERRDHLVPAHAEISALRPRTPVKKGK